MFHTEFSGIITADALSHFISHETGNILELYGCLADLDKLARGFLSAPKSARKAMTVAAEKMVRNYDNVLDKKRARYYVKTMTKMTNDSAYALKEFHRIERLLSPALSKSTRRWMDNRINILSSFTFASDESVNGSNTFPDEPVQSSVLKGEVNASSGVSALNDKNVKDEL